MFDKSVPTSVLQQPQENNQIRASCHSKASVQTMGEHFLLGLSKKDSRRAKRYVQNIQCKSRLEMRTIAVALPTISDTTTCESSDEEEVGDWMPRSRPGEVLILGNQCIPMVDADLLVSEHLSSYSESCTSDEADYQDFV